jgi:hypothetical protein
MTGDKLPEKREPWNKGKSTILQKDMTQPVEKYVDWWVRYFQKEIPFKVTWNWKRNSVDKRGWDDGSADGICYRANHEVRFKRTSIMRWLKQGKQGEIRNLVGHEMAHFLHKDHAHKSGRFAELKKNWNFKE